MSELTGTRQKHSRKKLDIDRLLLRVLELLTSHAPESLTYSIVSRHCGVPRPTLYYYFGPSPRALVEEAIRFGMKMFVQFNEIGDFTSYRDWKTFEAQRMRRSTRRMLKYPWIVLLYARLRLTGGPYRDSIVAVERQYYQEMARVWHHFHGKAPSEANIRFASYLKLGLLLGFADDNALWRAPKTARLRRALLLHFTQAIHDVLAASDSSLSSSRTEDLAEATGQARSRPDLRGNPVPARLQAR